MPKHNRMNRDNLLGCESGLELRDIRRTKSFRERIKDLFGLKAKVALHKDSNYGTMIEVDSLTTCLECGDDLDNNRTCQRCGPIGGNEVPAFGMSVIEANDLVPGQEA